MDKCNDLQQAQRTLLELWVFLKNYLPLANAHNTSFIVNKYWEKYVPSNIRQELLNLDLQDLAQLPNGTAKLKEKSHSQGCTETEEIDQPKKQESIGKSESISSVNRTNTCTVKYQSQDVISKGSKMDSNMDASAGTGLHARPSIDSSKLPTWTCDHLYDFVAEARKHSLLNLIDSAEVEKMKVDRTIDGKWDEVFVTNFMDVKKAHEVEEMAGVCAHLAHVQNIHHVSLKTTRSIDRQTCMCTYIFHTDSSNIKSYMAD